MQHLVYIPTISASLQLQWCVKDAGSPLGFFLLGLQDGQLAGYDGGPLNIRFYQSAVGRDACSFAEFFDLVEDKRRIAIASGSGSISLVNGFLDDTVHGCLGNCSFSRDRIREVNPRVDLKLVLSI